MVTPLILGMPQIMQTGATPRSSRSPTPLQTTDQTTGVITEQKLLIVSNNSVGNSSVSAASSEVIDKDHLLSPMTQVWNQLALPIIITHF